MPSLQEHKQDSMLSWPLIQDKNMDAVQQE